jgi:hypothetical protein
VDDPRAPLRQIVAQMDHMSAEEKVDVLISVATQAIGEVLLLADSVLEPAQAKLLREKAEKEVEQ